MSSQSLKRKEPDDRLPSSPSDPQPSHAQVPASSDVAGSPSNVEDQQYTNEGTSLSSQTDSQAPSATCEPPKMGQGRPKKKKCIPVPGSKPRGRPRKQLAISGCPDESPSPGLPLSAHYSPSSSTPVRSLRIRPGPGSTPFPGAPLPRALEGKRARVVAPTIRTPRRPLAWVTEDPGLVFHDYTALWPLWDNRLGWQLKIRGARAPSVSTTILSGGTAKRWTS